MTLLTVNIKDENKVLFFKELIKKYEFINIVEDYENDDSLISETVQINIKKGFKEIKLIEAGKIQSRYAKDFLNEL